MTHPLDTLAADQIAPFGAYGPPAAQDRPGVVAVLREDFGLATLATRKGAGEEFAARLSAAFGLAPPDRPRAAGGADLALLGTAPGRWLAVSQTRADLADMLAAALGAHAAVTEQGDALVAFDLSGAHVLDLLAKGVAIDLHPDVFAPGDVAVTDIAHIGATLWRTGETGYRLFVARSFTTAFSRFLVASAAEYGFRLDSAPGTGRG